MKYNLKNNLEKNFKTNPFPCWHIADNLIT